MVKPVRILWVLLLGVILISMAACGQVSPQVSPTVTSIPSVTLEPTATQPPSPTATEAAPLAVLLAGPDANPAQVQALQPRVAELAAQAGLRFQLRPELKAEPGLDYVVVVPPYPEVAKIAAEMPSVRFLALGFVDVPATENLFVIQPPTANPDQLSFIAGYMAAAITPDWRVGVVLPLDAPSSAALQTGFENGVYYLCGLCRPVYPPFPLSGYPLIFELTQDSQPADWQSTLTFFTTWQVETVFVASEVASNGLMNLLAGEGINLISPANPIRGVESGWVASIRGGDPLVHLPQAWEQMLSGMPGEVIEIPLGIQEVNPQLLSPGRQQFVEDMMEDLFAGYIGTGVEVDPE